MLVILIGYPGSQKIVKASKYLTSKYLPTHFHTIYLNYTGEINGWSQYLIAFLEYLTDRKVIFALDDYLLANKIDGIKYLIAESKLCGEVVCVKLCHSTEQEHLEYPVTTQYCIWDRKSLINILKQVRTPWEFEIDGSRLFRKVSLHQPCLEYFTNSSISGRWGGIKLDGLNKEDSDYIINNLLPIGTTYHKTGEYAGTSGELKQNEKQNGFI